MSKPIFGSDLLQMVQALEKRVISLELGVKPPSERYTTNEAVQVLGISRATLYKRVKDGNINLIKDGSKTFFAKKEIDNLLIP